ncbi:extracellular solute-binding protein [Kitasatospora xanthocidica]|uniref:Extracellular solute-binding protein n=1 Tax=Kitasatospora xanthocidica TaxID=83382 RepID=A0A372ZMP5_9ACTN|nr:MULTISPECIES: extracellular solute-binding protein [Streptomycetaceae]OKI06544.1 sugar ABC transporter substrate-binding protein [Streptomyces sp. CB02056]RGD56991.1 extracellular solute-binding protein [Kitasatospora xanthocidica]
MATSRTLAAAAVCAAVALGAVTGCSSSGGFGDSTAKQSSGGKQDLTVLIATSGEAETAAVKAATAAWAQQTGNTVTVQIASNINQQLGQALAGGTPPDLFYVNSDQFANYAKGGSLYAYGDQIPDAADFSEQLRKAFSNDGKLTCLPKDSSTLGLAINTDLWKQAGLTEADYPTTWQQLSDDAAKLTKDGVTGLVTAPDYQRVGALLKEAGGWITDPEQKTMTADSPANKQALEYLQSMMKAGSAKYVAEVDAGWGGEALGKGKAAMTIEGNWLKGAMAKDFPNVPYKVLPLPAGPAGPGTLAFSNCWGIAAKSTHQAAGVDLVKHLTSADQQLEFSKAFGVMPSRTSALATYAQQYPESKAWVDGVATSQPPVTIAGFNQVLTQFNTDLQSLKTGDPAAVLGSLQRNGEQALKNAK